MLSVRVPAVVDHAAKLKVLEKNGDDPGGRESGLNEGGYVIYRTSQGRISSGEAIGILLLDTSVPFIPGDVANATTYDFPVRFQKVEGFSVARAVGLDSTIYPALRRAAVELAGQGVRAITGDCGFMALHQRRLADELEVPVFLTSLLQIPFILSMIGGRRKVAIFTADGRSLDDGLLGIAGIGETDRLIIEGMETRPGFRRFALEENGLLDSAAVETEVVEAGRKIVADHDDVGAFLLECSLLPPYGKALQDAVGLPVFDYITMIDYVFSAVVRKRYYGFL